MSTFEEKIYEIIKLDGSANINYVFNKFEVNSMMELEQKYKENQNTFCDFFFRNVQNGEQRLNRININTDDFLSKLKPNVRNYIEFQINFSNEGEIKYYDWDERKFDYCEFSLDDILEINRFLEFPPLPFMKNYSVNNEHLRDKNHITRNLMIQHSFTCINALSYLCEEILSGNIQGDFKLILSNGIEYSINKFVISQYNTINFIGKENSISLDTENETSVKLLIKFLYGCMIDLNSVLRNDVIELHKIADYLMITTLIQICEVSLSDQDFDAQYKINRKIESIKRWFNRAFKNHTEELKLYKERMIEIVKTGSDEISDICSEMRDKFETNESPYYRLDYYDIEYILHM